MRDGALRVAPEEQAPRQGQATGRDRVAEGRHGRAGAVLRRDRMRRGATTALGRHGRAPGQGQGVATSRLRARKLGQGAARLAASRATGATTMHLVASCREPRWGTSHAHVGRKGASGHAGAVPRARPRQGGRTEPGAGTPRACRAGAGEEGDEEERRGGGDGRRGRTSSRGRGGSEQRGRGGGEMGELCGKRERKRASG
jgi:hypothetical protein